MYSWTGNSLFNINWKDVLTTEESTAKSAFKTIFNRRSIQPSQSCSTFQRILSILSPLRSPALEPTANPCGACKSILVSIKQFWTLKLPSFCVVWVSHFTIHHGEELCSKNKYGQLRIVDSTTFSIMSRVVTSTFTSTSPIVPCPFSGFYLVRGCAKDADFSWRRKSFRSTTSGRVGDRSGGRTNSFGEYSSRDT